MQRLLTTEEAAKVLGLAPSTLNGWRTHGRGPMYFKIGRLVFYDYDDLVEFKASRKIDPAGG